MLRSAVIMCLRSREVQQSIKWTNIGLARPTLQRLYSTLLGRQEATSRIVKTNGRQMPQCGVRGRGNTVHVKSRTPPQHSVASEYVVLSAVSRPGDSPNSNAGTPHGLRVTKLAQDCGAATGDGEAKGFVFPIPACRHQTGRRLARAAVLREAARAQIELATGGDDMTVETLLAPVRSTARQRHDHSLPRARSLLQS